MYKRDVTCAWPPFPLSHLLGPLTPSSVTYFMDDPLFLLLLLFILNWTLFSKDPTNRSRGSELIMLIAALEWLHWYDRWDALGIGTALNYRAFLVKFLYLFLLLFFLFHVNNIFLSFSSYSPCGIRLIFSYSFVLRPSSSSLIRYYVVFSRLIKFQHCCSTFFSNIIVIKSLPIETLYRVKFKEAYLAPSVWFAGYPKVPDYYVSAFGDFIIYISVGLMTSYYM